ncbi:axonemal dynein light chain domain-containing protein 1 isoform X2 [Thalassophryne amazonica]|uniref:axonemal dynein light chain domain-containing protein 1 isoform X2 n=1 Tax=Thalassophryne amazonica TaxID=390379 RepID=UPI001470A614|nr:axonemal dynein light chain domain-containing protein 1 isoform X2 [Thalassophryne amazonica]
MYAPMRAISAPGSSRPQHALDSRGSESRKTFVPLYDHNCFIPDEVLASLSSTVGSSNTVGQTAHLRNCKGAGIRRPDAVWHHSHGRRKYKYFLEQPTSMTGAGRDISFLCDVMVNQKKTTPLPPLIDRSGKTIAQDLSVSKSLIPEEYHIVKNKGIRALEFYEDAFTVQLKDEQQNLRMFPSMRPSGRLEVVQLMNIMDDMLEKAGVNEQTEELTELSQMQGLLELVRAEQNIYNVVFHELIRQVSVDCAERGQLLAKLRQRYQSLLERIPPHLKALHTEVLAQRALDRRLTEEILHIKTTIQQLDTELTRIRDHDAFVTQQAERAKQKLAEAHDQTHTNSDVVQGYHELYELQRQRLETELLQMTEQRDCWSQLTFCLALKVISVKKLQLVSRLHVSGQSWSKIAENYSVFISSKDTEDMNVIMELADQWKEQITAVISQLKKTEHAQWEVITTIQQGVTKWLTFCSTHKSSNPTYQKDSEKEIYAEVKQWSKMLMLQCERYKGEELLCCQETLDGLGRLQESWLGLSLQMFSRHPARDSALPECQQAMSELDGVISDLHKRLDILVSGESGIHRQIMSMVKLMDSWIAKLGAVIGQPYILPASEWLKLEKALNNLQRLAEEMLQNVFNIQTEDNNIKNKLHLFSEIDEVFVRLQELIKKQSSFFDSENKRLREEVISIHMAQIRWMLELLVFMVPDHSYNQGQEQVHHFFTNGSLHKLEEDAKKLAGKLDYFSSYLTSSCWLILEVQIRQRPNQDEAEHKVDEFSKLQRECSDWLETCEILLSAVKAAAVEQCDQIFSDNIMISPAVTTDLLVNEKVSAEPGVDNEIKDEPEAELTDGASMVCESLMLKLIGYDGNITHKNLEETKVLLNRTREPVTYPATDEARKALCGLETVKLLQQQLHDSEVQLQRAEQRALKNEEALQTALQKIQELERQLQSRSSLEPTDKSEETPPPSPQAAPTPETEPTSNNKTDQKTQI